MPLKTLENKPIPDKIKLLIEIEAFARTKKLIDGLRSVGKDWDKIPMGKLMEEELGKGMKEWENSVRQK